MPPNAERVVKAIARRVGATMPGLFDVRDLEQYGWVGVLESHARGVHPTWERIHGAIIDGVRSELGRSRPGKPTTVPTEWLPEHPDPDDGPEIITLRRDTVVDVRTAVRALNPRDRELVHHLFWDELKGAALAQAVGVTESAISHKKKRIYAQLREMLEDA